MARIKDTQLFAKIEQAICEFEDNHGGLPGISNPDAKHVFILQVIDSVRRQEYVRSAVRRCNDPRLAQPLSGFFNPIKGAAALSRVGSVEEACWLTFLGVQFGMTPTSGWKFVEAIYGAFSNQVVWSWPAANANPAEMTDWIASNFDTLRQFKFGNHRRYATLKDSGTGKAIRSYVEWVGDAGGHGQLFQTAINSVGQNPEDVFEYMYKSMSGVHSFGRLGKFDYITMLGKLGLAPVVPGKAYFREATGPQDGVKLFFGGGLHWDEYERLGKELARLIDCDMQVIEDALCNWQKDPQSYVYFRG